MGEEQTPLHDGTGNTPELHDNYMNSSQGGKEPSMQDAKA